MPDPISLNQLRPSSRQRVKYDWEKPHRSAANSRAVAHFGDVASAVEKFILESEALVGCVAWLSSPRMIDALAGRPVSLVVNKEWSLRSTDRKPGSVRLRSQLNRLQGGLRAAQFPEPVASLRGQMVDLPPVRCLGHVVRGDVHAPLMHHKFLVRLRRGKPVAVWTGSINLTVGAERNLENGVEIHDHTIAAAFLEEWCRAIVLSEPLEFRAGSPTATRVTQTPQPRGRGKPKSEVRRVAKTRRTHKSL